MELVRLIPHIFIMCIAASPAGALPSNGPVVPLFGSFKDNFAANYKAVVTRLSALPNGTTFYPSNTVPPPPGLEPAGCPALKPGDTPTCGFKWAGQSSWRSGFFPGLLWQLANETGDKSFAVAAAAWTAGREVEKTNTGTHDVGFMVFCSFGNGILLGNHNTSGYTSVIIDTAHSLAQRYNAEVGMTRSWGDINDDKKFEVIVDNLQNLELLLWASAKSGNKTLASIAKSHAKRTGELWIRTDGSTAHLCVFDPKTGDLISPGCTGTPQGYAANSTWARGQSWAIYGFTMVYRYTQDQTFLNYAKKVAEYYVNATASDQVPLWDFDAPSDQLYKDSSGAAIAAAGMLELARATGDSRWQSEAEAIIYSLGTESGLFAPPASVSEAVLISNHHDCKFDACTVIETEYYLYEALRRLEGHFPPSFSL